MSDQEPLVPSRVAPARPQPEDLPFEDWASHIVDGMPSKAPSQVEWEIVEALTIAHRLGGAAVDPASGRALHALVVSWRKREMQLCRKADAQSSTQFAQRLAAEAEGYATCADELAALLVVRPERPQREEHEEKDDQVARRDTLDSPLADPPQRPIGETSTGSTEKEEESMNDRARLQLASQGDIGDYGESLQLLPDSLERSLAQRIRLLMERADRETHLAVRLREKLHEVAGAARFNEQIARPVLSGSAVIDASAA